MTDLKQLRVDPEATIHASDFFVDSRGFVPTLRSSPKGQVGGTVTIQESKIKEEGVTRLTLTPSGTDFFFPWATEGYGGVGEVQVPVNQPNGTIVATNGMNGCALQVNRNGSNLIFYHDADSKFLKDPPGVKLCRIEPNFYMRIPRGEMLVEDFRKKGIESAYLYQMLCIRHDNKWKVVYSGVIIKPGLDTQIICSFTPGSTKFLVSFDE